MSTENMRAKNVFAAFKGHSLNFPLPSEKRVGCKQNALDKVLGGGEVQDSQT